MADDEKERFHRALDFMKMLGISQSVVAPVLRRLVKLYDNDWSLIEDENYRALADSYFDEQECKESKVCPRVTRNTSKRIAANEALSRIQQQQRQLVIHEPTAGIDCASKERQEPLQQLTRSIIDNTLKERQAPLITHELVRREEKINHGFARCEEKTDHQLVRREEETVQAQNNPMKLGFLKQEPGAYSLQIDCLTFQEVRPAKGVTERCQEAAYERCSNAEENKMPVKRLRIEATSLPTGLQKETKRCLIDSPVPTVRLPLKVKDEPIELPQPGSRAAVATLASTGSPRHKPNNPGGLVENDTVQHEQRRIPNGGRTSNNALSQIASAYDGQTSEEEAPSAFHNKSLILNQKVPCTAASPSPWSSRMIIAKRDAMSLIPGDRTLVLSHTDVHAPFPSPSASPSTSTMIVCKKEEGSPIPGDRTLILKKDVHAPFPSPTTSRMVVVKQEEAEVIPDYGTLVMKQKDVHGPSPCTLPPNSRMIVERTEATASHDENRTLVLNRVDVNASLPSSSYISRGLVKQEEECLDADVHDSKDISRGQEPLPISVCNDLTDEKLPGSFHYISKNITFQDAYVNFSLARIGEEDCCEACTEDCLRKYPPCHCARETGGEFAYSAEGRLRKSFLEEAIADKRDVEASSTRTKYCDGGSCMLELGKPCKGHLIRKFIKECWSKCQCNMQCGNRIVQKGIQHKLQVFLTSKRKGWGVRTLEDLPAGTFVCEYVGEILTNTELDMRNNARKGHSNHYPVLLDSDWSSETILKDEELLCLDATHYGNVARFINHRCFDANLVDIPVEIESPDHHYYHIAFFTTRLVKALEELTWDYCIDFEDEDHPIKAFRCFCESRYCRGSHHKT